MTTMIAVVQITAALTAAVLAWICLVSTSKSHAEGLRFADRAGTRAGCDRGPFIVRTSAGHSGSDRGTRWVSAHPGYAHSLGHNRPGLKRA